MPSHNIVVVGASAGGVEALSQLVKALPKDFPAALLVVVHFPPNGFSLLPAILNRIGSLDAHHAIHGESIVPGRIYIAPPDQHLKVYDSVVQLNQGPKENGHRPAIDALFRSAAYACRQRVVGVVLTGTLDDGTAGLAVIKSQGGVVIVQDPEEALFPSMPLNAIEQVAVDYVLPLKAIASQIDQLARDSVEESTLVIPDNGTEAELVAQDKAALERGERPGTPSPFTCPDCGGVLWELREGNLLRYRCHLGHAYSPESMLLEQANGVEAALWSAMRALEEKAALARRMAVRAQEQNRFQSWEQFIKQAEEAENHAAVLRKVIDQQRQADEPVASPTQLIE